MVGADGGYNWQRGSWVYGLETDLSGGDLETSMSGGLRRLCPDDVAAAKASIDWYGTSRARVGWTAGNAMFYGTGGLAYGRVDLNSTFNTAGLMMHSDSSSVRAGWVAGGGIEYMLRPYLFFTLGYQHVDLGTVGLASMTTNGLALLSQTANAHAAFDVFTVGLNWRFSPSDMTPMPWQGGYVGGHGGGAWGLKTDVDYARPLIAGSDIRLKRDVVLVGRRQDGLGLYRYRYLWSDTVYVGVMAQEVALIRPDAIVRNALDDYLRVDYGRLGMKLMTLPEWSAEDEAQSL